jgi:cytochrome c oxidase subunit IV
MMSAETVEDIRKHVRIYVAVFIALMALTIVTVAISYLHLSLPIAVALALFVALIKGSLVAGFFMHLVSEKKAIYAALVITVVFFLVLLFMPIFWHADTVTYQ